MTLVKKSQTLRARRSPPSVVNSARTGLAREIVPRLLTFLSVSTVYALSWTVGGCMCKAVVVSVCYTTPQRSVLFRCTVLKIWPKLALPCRIYLLFPLSLFLCLSRVSLGFLLWLSFAPCLFTGSCVLGRHVAIKRSLRWRARTTETDERRAHPSQVVVPLEHFVFSILLLATSRKDRVSCTHTARGDSARRAATQRPQAMPHGAPRAATQTCGLGSCQSEHTWMHAVELRALLCNLSSCWTSPTTTVLPPQERATTLDSSLTSCLFVIQ